MADALAVFDAATITTTHGFCQLVLASLGVAGRVGVGATLIEDASDTVDEAVDDLFLRRVLGWGVPPSTAKTPGRSPRRRWPTRPRPSSRPAATPPPGRQRRLAERVRREVARRLLDRNLLTYDDLLVRLQDTLADPDRGAAPASCCATATASCSSTSSRTPIPVQWEVVRDAFGRGPTTLVLIGDPKQAIYAFRGADVYAYLDAARLAEQPVHPGRELAK